MSLQIVATADLAVWSPVQSRVLIGFADAGGVSIESTKVDKEELQT